MRTTILLAGAAVSLTACGDSTAPQSVGSVATSGTSSTGTSTSTSDTFVSPTVAHTYAGIGGVEHYEYSTQANTLNQTGQLYAGDSGTARDGGFTIAYDPRDAIFDITINRPKGIVSATDVNFQDPEHRTNFGGLRSPQADTPNLDPTKNIQYLQEGSQTGTALDPGDNSHYATMNTSSSSAVKTFFYQKPGTTTQYVTYGGYLSNTISGSTVTNPDNSTSLKQSYSFDRAVFVWGQTSDNGAVPKSGTGTYSGDMIATMVFNDRPDTYANSSTYFQWIDGKNTTAIDFGKLSVSSTFTGTATAPAFDANTDRQYTITGGSAFNATAHATIDLVGKGGFSGSFDTASFTRPDNTVVAVNIAGSSLDGTFYGPSAQEIGGSFRVVGGTPDQRIDIVGAFTGKKP